MTDRTPPRVDEAMLERWLDNVQRLPAGYKGVNIDRGQMEDVILDLQESRAEREAMRAVLRDVAARNPIEWDEHVAESGDPNYYRCNHCRLYDNTDDPQAFRHEVRCTWDRAVELLGDE